MILGIFEISVKLVRCRVKWINKLIDKYKEMQYNNSYENWYLYTNTGYVQFCVSVHNMEHGYEKDKRWFTQMGMKVVCKKVGYKKMKEKIIPMLKKKFNLDLDLNENIVYYANDTHPLQKRKDEFENLMKG